MGKCVTNLRYLLHIGYEPYPDLSLVTSSVVSCVEGYAGRLVKSAQPEGPPFSTALQDALHGLAKLPLTLFQERACDIISIADINDDYIPNACQPAFVDQFEHQFNVDVDLQWGAATSTDFQQLASAMLLLAQIRPEDAVLIQSLSIHNGSPSCMIIGQAVNEHRIDLLNLFSHTQKKPIPLEQCTKLVPGYFDNYSDYLLRGASNGALNGILLHELGHLVGMNINIAACMENPKITYKFLCSADGDATPDDYSDLGSNETFAEDYRIYCMSHGQEVMMSNRRGALVPNYEDRLHYMKSHFILANKPNEQTPADIATPELVCSE